MNKWFLLLLLFSFLEIQAQKKYEFSGYTDKYLFELNEFLSIDITKEKKEKVERVISEFTAFYNSDTLSEANKKSLIQMSNLLTKNRFGATPTFYYFIDNILALKRNKANADQFEDWLKSTQFYVERKRVAYLHQYLQYSLDYFDNHFLYEKGDKVYKVSSTKMKISEEEHNPIFILENVNLIGTTKKDSTVVYHTNGTYYPLKNRWVGMGGKVFWERHKLDTNAVYAVLLNYKIDLQSNLWRADSVTFYDKRRFSYSLQGTYRDNFGYSIPDEHTPNPSFTSFRHDLVLKDVFPEVDFQGGYTLHGLKVIGSAEGKDKAFFIFKHKGKRFVWAGSQTFIIEDDRIISDKVTIAIYLETVDSITHEVSVDSIYHPGLSMYYTHAKRNLSIFRKEEGLSKTPFNDSYHKVDLYVEQLNWKMDEDYINMNSLQQKGIESKAYFESVNLFSNARYEKLTAMDAINPVEAVYNFTQKMGTNEFWAEDFGNYMKMDKSSTIAYLLNLATKGFLIYNIDDHYVIAKENIRTYVLAHQGKTDYDVIGFNSVTNGIIPNASLNLRNNEIILQGISTVYLSDSQDVKIIPKYGRIVLKKNRDFDFDGKIMAGRFDLYGKRCNFSYDKFELDLPSIDSLSFKVVAFEANDYGEKPLVRVKAVIEDVKGNILIDHPNNKSGRESFPEYPILNSKSNSNVYYDRSDIFNKVYSRDNFYFRLETFSIDSLDDFETEGLEFKGYLASAGIFPDIEQPLQVQRDYSLGFKTATGSGGLGIYGGKARFTDSIQLSNSGLRGSGELKYLTSTAYSKDYIFFPDSTNARIYSYQIEERTSGVEYPPLLATNAYMHFEPQNDLMEVNTIKEDEPFKMYNTEATMTGLVSLSPTELIGNGEIHIKNAEMESQIFHFKNRTYNSDSCVFRLRSFVNTDSSDVQTLEESQAYAYSTEDNFSAIIDFDKRKGEFESMEGSKPVKFDENMYMCFMDQFTWYMDEEKTEFSSDEDPMAQVEGKTIREQVDLDIGGTQFISLHPNQDSLSFFAGHAVYLQRKKMIHAYSVPHIYTADAAIVPSSHEVKIFAKARMDEFTDAQLLVNVETKYHLLYNGTFTIRGLHSYDGRALYDYKDEEGNIQNVYFGNISVDTAGFTVAKANVEKSANFTLSKYFDFEGAITLVGAEKYLTFSGGTRISHSCDTLAQAQIRFKTRIDPANIKIPIGEDITDMYGTHLFSGLKAKTVNGKIYSAFLTNQGSRTDHVIMQSFGYLIFDKITQEYRISSEDKLAQRSLPGNYLSLSKRECSVYVEGQMDVAYNTGHVQATAYGKADYFMKLDSTVMNISLPLNFFFSEKALNMLASDLNGLTSAKAVNLENDVYKIMLGNKLGAKEADAVMSKIITNNGEFRRIPKELTYPIFISDVKMKYNSRTRSLVSTDAIGIVSIGSDQILKYIDGKLEIINKGETFEITLALDLGNGQYYYFNFKGNATAGSVKVYSSKEEFNTLIKETKADDRKVKTQGKEPKFNYYIDAPTAYKKFMREMEMKQ
jgi:hypothetical protein